MLTYPDIDPVAISFGPVRVHWYGLMYLLGFAVAWWLGLRRASRPGAALEPGQVSDLIFYGALGAIVGGRLGYVLFYDLGAYVENPLAVFQVWKGGMSFHGGLTGVIIATWWFGRRIGRGFFVVSDFLAPLVPIGLGAGRIGNFINGELWGRTTDVPWAMVFPGAGLLPRHPSQLYEAFLEGLVLFLVIWIYSRKRRPPMAVSGLFLTLYGLFRMFAELFRAPDAHIGFVAFQWITIGQVLSLPMVLAGLVLIGLAYYNAARTSGASSTVDTDPRPRRYQPPRSDSA